jgi:hypothetical protein
VARRKPRADVVRVERAELVEDERAELERLRAANAGLEDRLWAVEQVINANADLLAEALKTPQELHPAATDPNYLASMGINTVHQYRHVLTEAEQAAALEAAMHDKLSPKDGPHAIDWDRDDADWWPT